MSIVNFKIILNLKLKSPRMTRTMNDNDFEGNFDKGKIANEDIQNYMKNLRLKEEITVAERTTLLQKVKLNDGSISDVVSCYRHLNSWKYICNLCIITSGNWKDFRKHIFGRKHTDKMNKADRPKKTAFMRNDRFSYRKDNPAKPYERERQFNFSKVKPLMEIILPHKFENKRTFNDQCKDATPKTTDTVGIDRSDIVMRKDRLYGAGEISHSYPTEDEAESSSLARFKEAEKGFYEYSNKRQDNLWKNYLERAHIIESCLLKEMKFYQENPEKHSKYDEEKLNFWEQRTLKLKNMGEDLSKYDINAEFNALWDIRLRNWFKIIFEEEKSQLRQQLQYLSMEFHAETHEKALSRDGSISDERDSQFSIGNNDSPMPLMRPLNDFKRNFFTENSLCLPIIPVLRELSVLESTLGYLGPKVVDLLTKALTFEKASYNGSQTILQSEENCLLLETVREKLKGLLESGLLPKPIIPLVKKAIQSIIDLLKDSNTEEGSSLVVSGTYGPEYDYNGGRFVSNNEKYYSEEAFADHDKVSKDSRDDGMNRLSPEMIHFKRSRSRERRFHSRDRSRSRDKSHSRERRSQSRERRSHSKDRRSHSRDKRRSRSRDRSYSRIMVPQHREKGHNENFVITRENVNSGFSHLPLSTRTVKVSEINIFINQLANCSSLTFIQKCALSQNIAISLLKRNIMEITEAELLILIKSLCPTLPENNNTASTSSQYSRDFNEMNLERQTDPSIINSSFLLINNNNTYSSQRQSSIFPDVHKNYSTACIVYPLKSNPYSSGEKKK